MPEIYSTLNPSFVVILLMFSVFAMVFQAFYLFLMSLGDKVSIAFEALLCLYLLHISYMLRMVNTGIGSFTILYKENKIIGYMLAFFMVSIGLYIFIRERKKHVLMGIVLLPTVLPLMGRMPYKVHTFCLVLSLLLLLARAAVHLIMEFKKRKREISEYSVKEALDSQHNGILFAEKDGNILLINRKMINLMQELTGKNFRSAENFWDTLSAKESKYHNNNDSKTRDTFICTSDNHSWQFCRKEISYKRKMIYQITAVDVTEQESINKKLVVYGEQLREQQDRLKTTLLNLEELCQEEAIGRSWDQVHGVLGQHISILQRLLNKKSIPEKKLLSMKIKELLGALDFEKEKNPKEEYKEILSAFTSLGIDLFIEGELPEDIRIASLFVEAVREGISNAIRHGQAHSIQIKFTEHEDYTLSITNKGKKAPFSTLVWGGGFTTIDRKVRELGGIFSVDAESDFTLKILISKLMEADGRRQMVIKAAGEKTLP